MSYYPFARSDAMMHVSLVILCPKILVLNRLLIVLCIVIVIVTSFFLFFWNRVLGWLLGFVIRTLLWKSANIWIDMGEC